MNEIAWEQSTLLSHSSYIKNSRQLIDIHHSIKIIKSLCWVLQFSGETNFGTAHESFVSAFGRWLPGAVIRPKWRLDSNSYGKHAGQPLLFWNVDSSSVTYARHQNNADDAMTSMDDPQCYTIHFQSCANFNISHCSFYNYLLICFGFNLVVVVVDVVFVIAPSHQHHRHFSRPLRASTKDGQKQCRLPFMYCLPSHLMHSPSDQTHSQQFSIFSHSLNAHSVRCTFIQHQILWPIQFFFSLVFLLSTAKIPL